MAINFFPHRPALPWSVLFWRRSQRWTRRRRVWFPAASHMRRRPEPTNHTQSRSVRRPPPPAGSLETDSLESRRPETSGSENILIWAQRANHTWLNVGLVWQTSPVRHPPDADRSQNHPIARDPPPSGECCQALCLYRKRADIKPNIRVVLYNILHTHMCVYIYIYTVACESWGPLAESVKY